MVKHLDVCPYGIEKDTSERVHLKVLYFYIYKHFTLTEGLGAIKGVLGGPHLVSYFPLCGPWVILA